jgi:hypothetical protein
MTVVFANKSLLTNKKIVSGPCNRTGMYERVMITKEARKPVVLFYDS